MAKEFKYGTRVIDFHSTVSAEDVNEGENILRENGVPEDKVQDILSTICEMMFDLTIYREQHKMERIAIIDHYNNRLFVEDVDMNMVNEQYNGSMEDYIADSYNLSDKWSWDYITVAEYIPIDADPMTIDFEEL